MGKWERRGQGGKVGGWEKGREDGRDKEMGDKGRGWGMWEGRGMGKEVGNEGCEKGKGDEHWEGGVWEQFRGLKPR